MSHFAGTATARVGWGDPDVFGTLMGLRVRIATSTDAALADLTTVTNVDLYVERPTGDPEVWEATAIDSTTATSMTLFHPYGPDDLPKVETLKITPRLYVNTDMYPCTSFRLNVVKG
jgi:hypothetical protein